MSKSLDSAVKILLADDSVTMHRAVSLALKKESYELVCVDNGKDALRLVHELRPQVILLDLDMPEKTGIEVAQEIRSDATLSGTQIVLLCGSFDEINEKDIEKAPVDARLWKPFESHVLLAMLRTLISARAPVSFASPAIATESTAPLAARPAPVAPSAPARKPSAAAAAPKVAAPKSRKEEAIESASQDLEYRFDQLPHESTEKRVIKEAVEATRPLSVSDLFDPSKRPPAPPVEQFNLSVDETGGDFTHELARETFGGQRFAEELPKPLEAAEKTAPKTAAPKEDLFINNLWSSEELSSYDEVTSFEDPHFPSEATDAPSAASEAQLDFEVLNSQPDSMDSLTSAHRADPTSAPWSNPASDQVFNTLHDQATREIQSTLRERGGDTSPLHSSITHEEVRRLVSEEIKKAFHSWLRDELQRQLNDVMSELDSELS